MKLKAITYSYVQDGILNNKVIGIFDKQGLVSALNDIRNFYKMDKVKIVVDKYDSSCDNYFIEVDNKERTYFYTSDFELNEIYL